MSATESSNPVLHHHFDTIEQQKSSHLLGMWMFLVTEAMFFGGIIAAYTAYRIWYPKDFEAASSKLNVLIAGINSFLLLTSSFTITMAIHAAHRCDRKSVMKYLMITALLGIVFLGFKAREYYNDYQEHLIPGRMFNTVPEGHGHATPAGDKHDAAGKHSAPDSPNLRPSDEEAGSPAHEFRTVDKVNPGRVQLFYIFYYCMTGLHVLHMIVGIAIILWLWYLAKNNFFFHPDRATSVEVISLYWHFVDMVWFFLVAILYCAGPHTSAQLHL